MKHTLFVGHYGTGKTTIAVDTALSLRKKTDKPVFLIDGDIVNPYFRAADSEAILSENGVELIKPMFANTNLDIPALPATVQSVFPSDCHAVWDIGGDDAGAVALGRYSAKIAEQGYEMLAVVNFYRPLTPSIDDTVELLLQVQQASRLKLTGIINNSNLGEQTDSETITATFDEAKKLGEKLGLPVVATTCVLDVAGCRKIINHTKKYF